MTTKLDVSCPQDSHWNLKVTTQNLVPDRDFPELRHWEDCTFTPPLIVGPGDIGHFYVWDTRRYIIEEVERN